MPDIVPKFLRKEKRKYPIIRDEQGKTIRARCFEAFDKGLRPAEVTRKLSINPKTAYQYHYQWKKLPENFEEEYQILRKYLKERPEARNYIIRTLSRELGMPEYKIKLWLESPWGLKQIKSGKWRRILERERKIEESKIYRACRLMIEGFRYKGLTWDEIIENLQGLVDRKSRRKGKK
jgi:hypothetical protein